MPERSEPERDLSAKVIDVIAQTQRIPLESISINSTFEELKIDSLDGINIVFALENEFNVSIPDEGVQNLHSVGETVEGIRKLLDQKAALQVAESVPQNPSEGQSQVHHQTNAALPGDETV